MFNARCFHCGGVVVIETVYRGQYAYSSGDGMPVRYPANFGVEGSPGFSGYAHYVCVDDINDRDAVTWDNCELHFAPWVQHNIAKLMREQKRIQQKIQRWYAGEAK